MIGFTLASEVTIRTLGCAQKACKNHYLSGLTKESFSALSFFRHWSPIWEKVFDSLLNTPSCAEQPSLRSFREEIERMYLEDEDNWSRQRQRHEVFMF